MLILGLAIFGLIVLVLAVVAIRANGRLARSGSANERWLITRQWFRLASLVLGTGSFFISYPLQNQGETWRVLGFPFFAAAFDPYGADYLGLTTIPAMSGNFLFFAALPQLILWATGRRVSRDT